MVVYTGLMREYGMEGRLAWLENERRDLSTKGIWDGGYV